jgi:hypothetical protein
MPEAKYYIATIFERNGERTYTHHVRFQTTYSPTDFIDAVASEFLGPGADKQDGGYYFNAGAYFTQAAGVNEIDREFFFNLQNIIDLAQTPEMMQELGVPVRN